MPLQVQARDKLIKFIGKCWANLYPASKWSHTPGSSAGGNMGRGAPAEREGMTEIMAEIGLREGFKDTTPTPHPPPQQDGKRQQGGGNNNN